MKKNTKITCTLGLLASTTFAMADTEGFRLSTQVAPDVITATSLIEVSAYADTEKTQSNGLGIAIAYDSSKITFESFTQRFASGLLSASTEAEVDKDDIDHNPQTDRLIRIAWMDVNGAWSAIKQKHTHLLSVKFSVTPQPEKINKLLTKISFVSLSTASTDTFATVQQELEIKG